MLIPFEFKTEALDRMLNFEIANHHIYQGLEIQGLDDEQQHGHGMVVMMSRRQDDLTDVYYESHLKLDQELFGIGGGLGLWQECEFDIARLAITEQGIECEIRFKDVDGRLIQVKIGDSTLSSKRHWSEFLAPVSVAIVHPKSLLLIWMSKFDLLYRNGPAPTITIDDKAVTIGKLPMEWLFRRRLVKVASDLFIVRFNPVSDTGEAQALPKVDPSTVTITSKGLESMEETFGRHTAHLGFTPPFPDLQTMDSDSSHAGQWEITLDGTLVTAGTWSATRQLKEKNTATMTLEIDQGWKPTGLPPLMKFVTWAAAKVFRHWPTTYKYSSTVSWASDNKDMQQPTMEAHWERTGLNDHGEAYRSMTGTKQ